MNPTTARFFPPFLPNSNFWAIATLGLTAILLAQTSWGQTTIGIHDFETVNASPAMTRSTATTSGSPGFSDVVTGNSPSSSASPASSPYFTSSNSGYRQAGPSSGTAIVTHTFGAVDTRNYTGVSVSLRVASMSIGSTGNGIESDDYCEIAVSPDNGTTWYQQSRLTGGDNSRWAFSGTGSTTRAYAANNTFTTTAVANGSLTGTNAITTMTVTGLPAVQNLRIRVQTRNDSANESWIIDDVRVSGTLAADPPTVTTGTSGSVTITSAIVSGNEVTDDGGAAITERGVVFSTSANPTTANGKAVTSGTTGSYNTSLTGLLGGTFYHARAFATNSAGTSYGSGITFTTEPAAAPSVTTGSASTVGAVVAILTGNNVTSDGGAPITERGIVFATTINPTTADSKQAVAGTTGAFDGTLNGLSPETPYYARAFATNSAGTTYGDEVSFTTTAISAPFVVTGTAGSIGTTTATISTNNVTSDGGSAITERGVVYSTTVFPTTASTKLTSAGTTGTFNSNLTGLTQGTVYYLRAYAINAAGTSYGAQIGFATNSSSVTRTFQEGVSSYTGTDDTFLDSGATTTNNGNATLLAVDGSPVVQALIRFNNIIGSGASQIPAGSTVTAASLRITVEDPGSGIQVYQMLADWTEASTWSSLTNGITADGTEAGSTRLGFIGANTNSSSNVPVGDRTITGLQSAVQAWVNGSTNNGLALLPFTTSGTNGVDFYSSEWGTSSQRPLLSVTYTPATPTVVLPPTVVTGTAGSLTPSGATISANNVTSDGGGTITERGVVYATTPTPTIANSKLAVAGTTGTFDANLTGLSPNTLYYARAFATNSIGTDYGTQISFTTTMAGGTITLTGSVTARSTTYGTASTAASFTVSGTGLTGDLTVTPPAGFETSLTEGSGYGATTVITASGTLANTTVYVRLAAATAPGNYSGNITVSGGGASSETLAIPSSTVSTKELTLTGAAVTSKPYDTTTAATITGTLSGIVGSDDVSFTGTGTFASANAGAGIAVTAAIGLTGADAANYTILQPTGLTGNIDKADQTITFAALPSKLVSDAPFALTATASSGLPVSYSSANTAVATISGSTLTIVGIAGSSVITASQAGDANYNPAPDVQQTQTVTLAPVVIAAWEVNGLSSYGTSPLAPSTVDANVTVVGLTRGSGVTTSGTAASNAWGGTGFDGASTSSGAVTAGNFVTFSVTPTNGYTLSLSQIPAYNIRRSSSGPTTGQWQYQVGGGAITDLGSAITWGGTTDGSGNAQAAIDLTGISALQNIPTGTTVTFRIVNYNASASTGTWYINNITGNDFAVSGALTPPAAVAATGQFDFAPHDGVATSFAYNGTAIPNVTVSDITYVGVTPGNNDPNLQGQWPLTGTPNTSGAANADLIGTPNTGAYYQFTLTADAGYILSNPKLRFGVGRELNGPRQFQWRSSVNGFSSPISATRDIDTTGTDTEIFSDEFRVLDQNFFSPDPINSTDYNEVSLTTSNRSAITFRFYAYGAEANSTGARLTRFLDFLFDVTQSSTTVPSAPVITGITANNNQLRIAFTPPSGTVTGYEYSLDGGSTWTATSPALPTSPLVINGLTNGQVYPVQLRASNGNGTGDASASTNGTPQPNTITGLAATDTRTVNGGSYALGATASSGLTVSYASSNTGVATVSGNTVTIVAAGTTTITASQAGDADFAAATDLTQSLTVLPTGWTLIENFEARSAGDLNAQNNWSVVVGTAGGTGTTTVTADPADAGNQVATLSGTHTAANRFLTSLSATETFTVFKRFRLENIDTIAASSGESHLNMGVSNFAAPSGPGDFTLHTSVTPTVTTPFRIRHTSETAPTNVTVTSDIWYSSWYVVDNSTGKFKLYVQGGAQTEPVLAADGTVTDGLWTFRNAGAVTAARIYFRALANHNAPAYVDDIYFAPGENLDAPVPSIYTTGTLAALSTTYGTASATTSFTVAGDSLTEGITVTAPAGFEVSTSAGSGFGSSVIVGAAGNVASTTVYVRLAATTGAAGSPYSGNIVLTSAGAPTVNVPTVSSTVNKADQTITFAALPSRYVNEAFTLTATASSGLAVTFTAQNGNVSVTGTSATAIGAAASTGTIRASQAGDANYNPAPHVDQSFEIFANAIQAWRDQNELDPTGSTGNSGNTQNADGDSLTNLQEFAFGTDPMNGASGPGLLVVADGNTFTPGIPTTDLEFSGGVQFTAQFVRRKDAAAIGLTYIPQFSYDNDTWESVATAPQNVATNDLTPYQVVEVPYLQFLTTGPHAGRKARYFRITVSYTGE